MAAVESYRHDDSMLPKDRNHISDYQETIGDERVRLLPGYSGQTHLSPRLVRNAEVGVGSRGLV